jgi:hypothetical protein
MVNACNAENAKSKKFGKEIKETTSKIEESEKKKRETEAECLVRHSPSHHTYSLFIENLFLFVFVSSFLNLFFPMKHLLRQIKLGEEKALLDADRYRSKLQQTEQMREKERSKLHGANRGTSLSLFLSLFNFLLSL